MGENESETPCCETCRFWKRREDGDVAYDDDEATENGECRRNAPRIILADAPEMLKDWVDDCDGIRDSPGSEDARRVFPLVSVFDWCGEYQPKQS